MTPKTSTPAMFRSARSSGNAALILFAAALLTAFALHAGAFLPRFSIPGQAPRVDVASSNAKQASPAVVAGTEAPGKPRG